MSILAAAVRLHRNMNKEIISRKIDYSDDLVERLIALKNMGLAKKVVFRHHSGRDIEPWAEVAVTTTTSKREKDRLVAALREMPGVYDQ